MPSVGPSMSDTAPIVVPAAADIFAIDAASVPALPEPAARVVALVADPRSTTSNLALAVAGDAALATRLVRLANSGDYATVSGITSVRESILRVGALAVRNLAVTLGLTVMVSNRRIYGAPGRALLSHGIGTAQLARLVADEAGEAPEQAFLCGLLHDIGKLVLLKWRYDHVKKTGRAVDPDAFDQLMTERHAEVGGMAWRRWGLPPELESPVLHHHTYAAATEGRRMAAVVYFANRLSHRYGFGCDPDGFEPTTDPVAADFGIDADWVAELDARAPGLCDVDRQGVR
jgi:putative nucleotidyltransferase with HDIG domain